MAQRCLGSSWDGLVAVDNAESIIYQYLRQGQKLALVTMTGELYSMPIWNLPSADDYDDDSRWKR